MMLTEYDEKETMKLFFRDGEEAGLEEGDRSAVKRVVQRMKELGIK